MDKQVTNPNATSRGPLDGIVVVSLEQAVAAPFATRQLADLGARVIKVERPGVGDLARGYDTTVNGLASHFVWLNRGKESIELDAKSDDGRRVLLELIAKADILVQNLAPGAADRLGIGARQLKTTRPDLITCDISGYGSGGSYEQKKAYDLLIQCESGLVSITGTPDVPSKVGLSIADIATGMYAYTGLLTALLHRQQTGEGSNIEVSMLEALGEWMGYPLLYTMYGGTAPARSGASHSTIAPYGPFQAGDGFTVNLGLQNEREWEKFCSIVLRQPETARDPRFAGNANRVAHRQDLDGLITEAFSELSEAQLLQRLEEAQIACAQQRSVAQFAEHPQLKERGRWRAVSTPTGSIQALIPPVTVAGRHAQMGAVPAVGQLTDSILSWLSEA
jgi:itaconate CoA-transferase